MLNRKKTNTLHTGHRERLKTRFIENGLESLSDHEILELLLTYGIPRRDVKNIAKQLILSFGDIENVLDASIEELCTIEGIGIHTATLIRLVRSLFTRCEWRKLQKRKDILSCPKEVAAFVRTKIGYMKDEVFLVIYLNVKNHVEAYEILSEGTKDQAVVYPRKIVEHALKKHAVNVIVAHNHPSGLCAPSLQDKNITVKIKNALHVMDISLLDHIIVSQEDFFSFLQNSLL